MEILQNNNIDIKFSAHYSIMLDEKGICTSLEDDVKPELVKKLKTKLAEIDFKTGKGVKKQVRKSDKSN